VIIYIISPPDIWLSERPLSYRIRSDVIQGFSHVTLQRIPTSDIETHTSEVKFYDPFFSYSFFQQEQHWDVRFIVSISSSSFAARCLKLDAAH